MFYSSALTARPILSIKYGFRQNDPCRLRVLCQLVDQVIHAAPRSPVNGEVFSGNVARVIGSQKDGDLADFLQNFPWAD